MHLDILIQSHMVHQKVSFKKLEYLTQFSLESIQGRNFLVGNIVFTLPTYSEVLRIFFKDFFFNPKKYLVTLV